MVAILQLKSNIKAGIFMIIFLISGFLVAHLYSKANEGPQTKIKYDEDCSCTRVKSYFENGALRSETQYKNEKLDGKSVHYYPNGNIKLQKNWSEGIPDGHGFSNHEDGSVAIEFFYNEGFKSGAWSYYRVDGSLKKQKIYEEGKNYWNSNLRYMQEDHYFDGEHAYSIMYEAGVRTDTLIKNSLIFELLVEGINVGKALFEQNCSMCHAIDRTIIGPNLAGVTNRRTSEWLTQKIISSNQLRESGDSISVHLFEEYNRMVKPDFDFLTEREVEAIITYLGTFE